MPHTVLPCSALGPAALGTAVPSAPSGMPLKTFAFGEPLTQVVPTEKPAAQHAVSSRLTTLSCNYTQPPPELCGKSVYPSPSNGRREDSSFLSEVTLIDVPIHTTGCRTDFPIRQLGMVVLCLFQTFPCRCKHLLPSVMTAEKRLLQTQPRKLSTVKLSVPLTSCKVTARAAADFLLSYANYCSAVHGPCFPLPTSRG